MSNCKKKQVPPPLAPKKVTKKGAKKRPELYRIFDVHYDFSTKDFTTSQKIILIS